jgi:cysteine desulfurase
MIDFDYNATTPLKEPVRRAMEPYLGDRYGNPSSIHQIGQKTKAAVEEARDSVAASVNADSESLVITGSGSEANTLALRGYLGDPDEDTTILTSPVEHSSVRDTVLWYEEEGAEVRTVEVGADGQLDRSSFENQLTPDVDLAPIMTVNNETGVRFPVEEFGELSRERDVCFHTDATQAYEKCPLNFSEMPVDMMTVSAHKVGGPKGVGALFAPKSIPLTPLIFGGHQERDRRGGTENVAGVVGFGEAVERLDPGRFVDVKEHRRAFEEYVNKHLDDVLVLGDSVSRVSNTSGMVIQGVEGEDVVVKMDLEGYATATGSACTSGSSQPSHVVQSIPLPEGYETESFVRFSFAPDQSRSTILEGARQLEEIVRNLRSTTFEETPTYGAVTQS